MKKKFSINKLKHGLILKARCGITYVVVSRDNFIFDFISCSMFSRSKFNAVKYNIYTCDYVKSLSLYNEDLKYIGPGDSELLDIMEVYKVTWLGKHKLIWKREELVKLTVDQISKKLGYKVEIVGGKG